MNAQSLIRSIGLFTVSLIFILGLMLLTGIGVPDTIRPDIRYSVGVIMLIYALYRGYMIVRRQRNPQRHEQA